VYVWEFPVRLFHWVNALCITLLVATGYLIGDPRTISQSNEAYQQYWFAGVRFVHFASAYICLFNFLARVYWAFAGNRWARWHTFLPLGKERLREIGKVIKIDVMELEKRELISIGHNTLAGLTYFFTFLAFLFQVATGFALYSRMSDGFIPSLFGWVIPLMGGDMPVRQWHHLTMWVFVVFVIIHVYLSLYHDLVEGRGTISAIIGGWKFERDEDLTRR
jgi:Ni/Fe-hydrogenase 1 B-type cytochrome subunit